MTSPFDPSTHALGPGLAAQMRAITSVPLATLFERDPDRFRTLSFEAEGIVVDLSKQHWTREALDQLVKLAESRALRERIDAMFRGDAVNHTEGRPALHVALRQQTRAPVMVGGTDVLPDIRATQERMEAVATTLRERRWPGATGLPVRTVINIGIGGSDLGPLLVCDALRALRSRDVEVRFVSNIDPAHLDAATDDLDPATTLFVATSKTFTTLETMRNVEAARDWLRRGLGAGANLAPHFIAVTAAPERAQAQGIPAEQILPFRDWVGGRYSVWSAVGLPVAISVGWEGFRQFLAGAASIDRHFREAPFSANLPVLLALSTIWNVNFRDLHQVVLAPYAQALARFPAYVQQLAMESNGKRVAGDGTALATGTTPAVWGEPGTNAQHAFFQWLHQGTEVVPVEFIVPMHPLQGSDARHSLLVANALAQGQALMCGRPESAVRAELIAGGMAADEAVRQAPHRTFPGGRPSTTLLVPRIDAFHLGQLIALFEHRTFVEAAVWGINPFDQFGVELGKRLTGPIVRGLETGEEVPGADGSTAGLIARLRAAGRA
jgi:glucose-6-phosphate isomerase